MGTLLWTRCAFADAFAILPDGSWVTAATLSRSVKIGDQSCGVLDVSSEGKDGALARYDSSGAWVSTSCAADPSYQFLGTVLPDPTGMFFMTAAFRSRLTLPDNSRVTEENGGWTSLIG